MSLLDSEMSSPGAGPSTLPSPSPINTLNIDLRARCRAMLEDARGGASTLLEAGTVSRSIEEAAYNLTADIDISRLLFDLSSLARHPSITRLVVLYFEPICLDLFARWLDEPQPAINDQESRICILAEHIGVLPEFWSLLLASLKQTPFQDPLSGYESLKNLPDGLSRLQSLLLAYYRMISHDVHLAIRLNWPLKPLYKLRGHSDPGVRLLSVKILCGIKRWPEAKRIQAEKRWLGEDDIQAPITFGTLADPTRSVSAWMLALEERRRVDRFQTKLCEIRMLSPSDSHVLPNQLSPRIALIANTLFFRDSASSDPILHVDCPSMVAAISDCVSPLRSRRPMLLTGPPSSGKSHLIRYLSSLLHPSQRNHIFTIPLADTSIDVKNLLGTYVSSPTRPGSFEWMEGALTKAVRAGRWVVFDDIDRASMEVLVMIAGLTRSKENVLSIPGRGSVEAGPGFAVFATRKSRSGAATPPAFFGHHEFTEVVLEMPSDEDVLRILSVGFGRLSAALLRLLVVIWSEIRLPTTGRKAREIGMRDLEKWCARVDRNLSAGSDLEVLKSNQSLQDQLLLDAADVFAAHWSTPQHAILATVAASIGMDLERAESLVASRRPVYELSSDNIHIGRITLPRIVHRQSSHRPFALTRPSLILLEQLGAGIIGAEPLLLVGETGTGKTTAVQHLANACGKSLTAFNLSTQTESSDLLGGFKPMDASVTARDVQSKWQQLFCESFSMAKAQNGAYLEAASKALGGRKWGRLAELWKSSATRAIDKLSRDRELPTGSPRKRRKLNARAVRAVELWRGLLFEIEAFDLHHVKANSKLVFQFVEGPLVKAVQNGDWILLDEVNLASQETLEALSTLLESPSSSLVLTDRGDVEPVTRHPNFRLFACMNPATDVGKKDLPPNLRNCFTEIYVPPPDDNREALVAIIEQYLGDSTAGDKGIILDVADLYTEFKRLSTGREIVDGSNIPPHYSMRTLARALMFAVETSPMFGLRRALWEGWLMAFTMSLDLVSAEKVHAHCERFILRPMKNARAVLAQVPTVDADHVRFGSFCLSRGPLPVIEESRYVMTPSVQSKLSDLARVILTGRYPVLIQGPTSSGKTSAIEFLARSTGHRFVRINNHEHTDIQEYLGTYVTDPASGNLVFQEGLLVTAVRKGHWIVLDELNLAPTDVLEALNRLLDDNRELVIPETQELIRPHPNFMLFATQNPPGLYAGRKVLSRAFRNRFLEVHFDDVPKDELETILCQRCQIAPSYARKIVEVFEELRHRRQTTRVFESTQSFATLRDLFRWAERGAEGYQQLAEDGYMLLAERARQADDKVVIKSVIEGGMKVTVDDGPLYDLKQLSRLPFNHLPDSTMVWTRAMQRLFTLVAAALSRNEPVLLVGETGCGKTSVCEVVAKAFNQQLVQVNCHQNMETADLIGSQRPIRNRQERRRRVISTLSMLTDVPPDAADDDLSAIVETLASDTDPSILQACRDDLRSLSALFEWSDGPLVDAMTQGSLLLLDEVSLADDSVLERLNSVLEPGRTLVLAEKGGSDIESATVVADTGFHVVATMNPGGDFGKKELSPALRNRFTEIWVPPLDDRSDLLQIIGLSWSNAKLQSCGPPILDFFAWFTTRTSDSGGLGLRDILAWVRFIDQMCVRGMSRSAAFHHGGQMVVVDGLESLPQMSGLGTGSISSLRAECLEKLVELSPTGPDDAVETGSTLVIGDSDVSIGGFDILKGKTDPLGTHFRFDTPTTTINVMRVFRACQLPKAILLEGSPGVGKTSLVSALAAVSGHTLQRINLSDQTDLIDLFGSDLPVDGGGPGEFQWREAAFLDAMQNGDWVLLDEMNLASQTVLEGLNAVLDHRGTVFIPELGRSFVRHPDFRIFAAQNPHQQGGGRKGLPKSFLNRFTKVYLQEQTAGDLEMICRGMSSFPEDTTRNMIVFNEKIREATIVWRTIGREGSPWEFNLRDLLRWFDLLSKRNGLEMSMGPEDFLRMVYLDRFRNVQDRRAVIEIYEEVFQHRIDLLRPFPFQSPSYLQIGHSLLTRATHTSEAPPIPHHQLEIVESTLKAVELGWLVILPGTSTSGNRELVQSLATASGNSLSEFSMHPGVDASEILGSFQQQEVDRYLAEAYEAVVACFAALDEESLEDQHQSLRVVYQRCRLELTEATSSTFVTESRALLGRLGILPGVDSARFALDALQSLGLKARGFTWVDGDFLTALRNGGWYLISEANLCDASVLDRLNSLCEKDGVLVLSEKGSVGGSPEIIKPHPDFRLFMTYDPKYGELSRAMRNRGAELYVAAAPGAAPSAKVSLQDSILDAIYRFSLDAEVGPSKLANGIAYQSFAGLSLLKQHGVLPQTIRRAIEWCFDGPLQAYVHAAHNHMGLQQGLPEGFFSSLSVDASFNPNIRSDDAGMIVRLLQLFIRNVHLADGAQAFVNDPKNKSTILAKSAHTSQGSARRINQIWTTIYPVIRSLSAILNADICWVFAGDQTINHRSVETLELVLGLVLIVMRESQTIHFNHSAIVLLAAWLRDAILPFSGMQAPMALVQQLCTAMEITRGLGQTDIWSMFRQRSTVNASMLSLDRISDGALRSSVLAAICLDPNAGLTAELQVLLPDDQPLQAQKTVPDTFAAALLLPIELHTLASHTKANVEQAIDILTQSTQLPLYTLVPLKTLSLFPRPGLIIDAVSTVLQRIVDGNASSEGPAFFAPVQLHSVLRFSDDTSTPLSDIPQHDAAVKLTIRAVLWSAETDVALRRNALRVADEVIKSLLLAFGAEIPTDSSLRLDVYALQSIPVPPHVANALTSHLHQPFVALAQSSDSLHSLGAVWLGISRLLLDLYVTNIPIDPAVRRSLQGEVYSTRIELLQEELEAVEESEMLLKGTSDSKRLRSVLHRLDAVRQDQASLGPAIDRPTDAEKLAIMHQEVFGFLDDTLSEKQIDALIESFVQGDAANFKREENFQLASAAFIHRLRARYEDIFDLVHPIITAILCAKFGLQCIRRHAELASVGHIDPVSSLSSFPSTKRMDMLSRIHETPDIPTSLLKAASMVQSSGSTSSPSTHMRDLVTELGTIYQAWSAIRLREHREQQDAESLYKVRKTDVSALSDLEREEQEFAELFPSYEGAGDEGHVPQSTRSSNDMKDSFPPNMVLAFHRIVSACLGVSETVDAYPELQSMVLRKSFNMDQYSEELDRTSLAFQIHSLFQRHQATSHEGSFNFYSSPNEPEARKAHHILSRLRIRLDTLITEWPEQMVLHHVRDRVDRILQLTLQSPVAQVLTALEGLMVHTDDWEPFANRENSLSAYRSEISALIISWRKLELSSWGRLLNDTYKHYIDGDAEWTLRLFGALIQGSVASTDVDKHLHDVLPMLKSFLSTSTFGQYAGRLQTLRVFHNLSLTLASSMEATDQGLGALRKISDLLYNVIANAALNLDRIESSMASQRKDIDKSIKDFIKLASWKDVNVFALKASAQKSHRQLYRSMRKFREVLQQPVSPILADLNSICPQALSSSSLEPLSLALNPSQPPPDSSILARASIDVALPKHLLDIGSTFSRYSKVLITGTQHGDAAAFVEQLSTDIIETSLDLAKATPSNMTKANKKIVQNLASRKRKAFADLLKALRILGFSQNVRADVLERQHSSNWIASRPALRKVSGIAMDNWIDRVQHYHSRQEVLMSALRGSLAGHNEDIATSDLQRGIGFTESLYASALGQRESLSENFNHLERVSSVVSRLTSLSETKSVSGTSEMTELLVKTELHLRQLGQSLDEVVVGVEEHAVLSGTVSPSTLLDKLHGLRINIVTAGERMTDINAAVRSSGHNFLSQAEMSTFHEASALSHTVADVLSPLASELPQYRHLLIPVADMARNYPTHPPAGSPVDISLDLWRESDELVQAMLVVAQGLPSPISVSEGSQLPATVSSLQSSSSAFQLEAVFLRLQSFCDNLESHLGNGSTMDLSALLSRFLPFCSMLKQAYIVVVKQQLQTLKANYKLAYVVGRIMLDLAQRGFCKPQEESADDGEGGDETVEGTGMGAGTGDKNVSEEITEEFQVEGLQGEEEHENDKDETGEGDDDAVSMDDDFAGEMGEGKEKDEEAEGEDQEDEDHDEMVGDVDPLDPGAVDEKFWDGEQEEKETKGDDEVVDGKQQETGESEMAAKDDKKAEAKEKQKESGEEAGEQEGEQQQGEANEEAENTKETDDQNEDDAQGVDDKQDHVDLPEGDTLDLPEDLNLDDTRDEADANDDMTLSGDEGLDEDAMDVDDDTNDNASRGEEDNLEETEEGPDATGAPDDEAMETEEEAGQQDLDLGGSGENDMMGQETDLGQGPGGTEDVSEEAKAAQEKPNEDAEGETAQERPSGKGAAAQEPQGSDQQDGSDGAIDSSGAPLPADSAQTQRDTRTLGDIMKDIRRRRDEILAAQERQSQSQSAPQEAPGQVEYVKEDETAEDQALGPAGEEERQKLADLNILDEEQSDAQKPPGVEDDDRSPEGPEDQAGLEKLETAHFENSSAERGPVEKALTQADVKAGMPNPDQPMDLDEYDEEGVQPDGDRGDSAEDDMDEIKPVQLVHSSTNDPSGEDTWRHYSALTSDLSYALCEQLRLILEPTQATRLQGDFRTGKRLNMRKIIPYIASEYTKDKIWLRRTKPSKREYQVLLSLDDSRSMAESHSVDLAHQTLALVCQALNKLEVGQVSIAKFGQSVDILHPFGTDGFSDLDGAKVIQSFNFDQHRTDVAALVDRTLGYLAEARDQQASTSSGAADLWQLQIIISDGVCQDHDKLRVLLRRAIEERVMIVFIILDSLNQQSTTSTTPTSTPAASRPSILSMQSVEYKMVNGEMQLEMTRYLDTFPFEFFVVLRDVEALPGVLSDTLRQWMARVSQSQE